MFKLTDGVETKLFGIRWPLSACHGGTLSNGDFAMIRLRLGGTCPGLLACNHLAPLRRGGYYFGPSLPHPHRVDCPSTPPGPGLERLRRSPDPLEGAKRGPVPSHAP